MRALIRPRVPVLALLLLAPTIPELLTGSTPVSELAYDPLQFAISFAGIVGLYGTGALLIREFAVYFRKGWASILLLGAAYGIAEEGLAVHTFFEPAGRPPVGALGAYGHAFGVNWLWALGLTGFHAVYSIALPILLVGLFYPEVRSARWLDRGAVALVASIYVFEVTLFSLVVGHGPTPALLALFLVIEVALIGLAYRAPPDLLSVRRGASRIGSWGLAFSGTAFLAVWVFVEAVANAPGRFPAVAAGAVLVAVSGGVIALIVRRVGTQRLARSEFSFAAGMLGALFVWDLLVEVAVPGVLGVAALFAALLYLLHRRLRGRERAGVSPGALGGSAT